MFSKEGNYVAIDFEHLSNRDRVSAVIVLVQIAKHEASSVSDLAKLLADALQSVRPNSDILKQKTD